MKSDKTWIQVSNVTLSKLEMIRQDPSDTPGDLVKLAINQVLARKPAKKDKRPYAFRNG